MIREGREDRMGEEERDGEETGEKRIEERKKNR